MAEALKRWDEATNQWVTVAVVNRIEVTQGGSSDIVYSDARIFGSGFGDIIYDTVVCYSTRVEI